MAIRVIKKVHSLPKAGKERTLPIDDAKQISGVEACWIFRQAG
jgi:hypothetical protein